MSKRYEMRFAGSGGQGVILASAVIAGLRTVQSQAYGPEARGGVSKAETVVSREQIWYSKVTLPNFLLALTQASLNTYTKTLAEGAVVMMDDSLDCPEYLDKSRVLSIPILRTAKEKVGMKAKRIVSLPILNTARNEVGKLQTANIVAVGAINAALQLFTDEELMEAVKRHIPAGTEEINRKALDAGKELITAEQAAAFVHHLG